MGRTDYFHDPAAPQPNAIKVAVSAVVLDESGRILMIRRTDNDQRPVRHTRRRTRSWRDRQRSRGTRSPRGDRHSCEGHRPRWVFSNPEHVIAYDDGEVRQEFSICFRARPTGGSPRTSEESKEVLWVAPGALDALDIHPSIKLRIERALEPTSPYFT